jgi:hypothetical protein
MVWDEYEFTGNGSSQPLARIGPGKPFNLFLCVPLLYLRATNRFWEVGSCETSWSSILSAIYALNVVSEH